MSFKKYDLITFDDDNKVVVLAALLDQGNEYLLVNEVLEDESDFKDKIKILRSNYDNGTLEKIIDDALISRLMPLFEKKMTLEMEE